MTDKTYFNLPNSPEEFSILLPPAQLRRIDFSALEFATARRAVIEYIRTYFPNDFNDFVTNNGIIMLVELLAYQTAILSLRSDMIANEAFLPTCQDEESVTNHLALINQRIHRASASVVQVVCSVENPVLSAINIPVGPTGVYFSIPADNGEIIYEIYRNPNDLETPITIPSGKKGIIAYGVEGKTKTFQAISDGSTNQQVLVSDDSILESPVKIKITADSVISEWSRVDTIRFGDANSQIFEVNFIKNTMVITFGDNVNGKAPSAGSIIDVMYRTGGGVRGRIGANTISESRNIQPDPPYTAGVQVSFNNPTPSTGGTDKESLTDAKNRAPREFATQKSAVTDTDYVQLSTNFSHPVFGRASKVVATFRSSLNANIVELYILTIGSDGNPASPSQGLKLSLQSYLDDINVLTDEIRVLDGRTKPIDVEMNVIIDRNADGSTIQNKVEDAITGLFNFTNRNFGQPLYLSDIYKSLNNIDGIIKVDVFKPTDNVLNTNVIANGSDVTGTGTDASTTNGVGINEIIVLGNLNMKLYYDKLN